MKQVPMNLPLSITRATPLRDCNCTEMSEVAAEQRAYELEDLSMSAAADEDCASSPAREPAATCCSASADSERSTQARLTGRSSLPLSFFLFSSRFRFFWLLPALSFCDSLSRLEESCVLLALSAQGTERDDTLD